MKRSQTTSKCYAYLVRNLCAHTAQHVVDGGAVIHKVRNNAELEPRVLRQRTTTLHTQKPLALQHKRKRNIE
jgi:hypothetical protein